MPLPINEGLVTRGLAGLFGLKGRFRLVLDETEVPVVITSQLDRSPFQLTKPCGIGGSQGAVAAQNSYLNVSPSTGVILCVDEVQITASPTGIYQLQRLTVANFVTAGAPLGIQFLRDFNNIEPPQPNGPRTSSTFTNFAFAGVLGDTVALIRTLGSTTTRFVFPDGYFLYGDDPAGIGGLAMVSNAVNISMNVSFLCREFRLPG